MRAAEQWYEVKMQGKTIAALINAGIIKPRKDESAIEKKSSKELIVMGYSAEQLKDFRARYYDDIVLGARNGSDGRLKNIIYNYTEMQRLGLTPTTRKKSQTT